MGRKRVAELTDFRAVVLKRLARACTEVGQAARLTALAMSTTLALPGPPALAQDDVEVDLELVLAVDISLSMDDEEQRLQRDGYVAAIRHPEIIAAIRDGLNGQIAVAYLEWADVESQEVLVAWSLIDGEEAADAFAEELAAIPLRRDMHGASSGGPVLVSDAGEMKVAAIMAGSIPGTATIAVPVTQWPNMPVDHDCP